MLLGANKDLENQVIQILTQKGASLAEDIQQNLTGEATLQAIYYVLRKLHKEGVVVKEGQRYSLRIPWILDLSNLVDEMENSYLNTNYIQKLLPSNEEERRVWRFTNLHKAGNFWSQVLLAMAKASQEKIMFDYSPHAWFHLAQPEQEDQYTRTLLDLSTQEYAMVGGRTYLDKWIAEKFWQYDNLEYYLAPNSEWPIKDRTKYLNVIGDYILTIKLEKRITQEIDKLFERVKDETQIFDRSLMSLFNQRVYVRMSLEKDGDKALKFKKKFRKIFGIRM